MSDFVGNRNAPQVVVSNLFGDINRGGAAITAETLRALLALGAQVSAVSVRTDPPATSHPHTSKAFPEVPILPAPLEVRGGPLRGLRQIIKSLYFLANPKSRHLPEALRQVAASKAVFSKGGYVFVDRASIKSLMSMWTTVFPLIFARRMGVPTATFPTSISPQEHFGSKLLNKWLLTGMTFVSPRDPLSATAARALGVEERNIVEVPDIVLGMAPPSDSAIAEACRNASVERGRFATMTIHLKNRDSTREMDLDALASAGRGLLSMDGIDEVLVVDQAGDPTDTRALLSQIGPGARLVDHDASPEELVALYGGSVLTVACRLHSAIFSLVAGTPAIAVSVTPLKAEGVYTSLGLPSQWVVPIDKAQGIASMYGGVLNHPKATTGHIRAAVSNTAEGLAPLRARLAELIDDAGK